MKKENKVLFWTLGSILIVFLLYVFVFVMWRPFMGEITQDRPIMKKLCEMQAECNVGKGNYYCLYKGQIIPSSERKLKKWGSYYGCNESTQGYNSNGDYGWIFVESCNCGGLM